MGSEGSSTDTRRYLSSSFRRIGTPTRASWAPHYRGEPECIGQVPEERLAFAREARSYIEGILEV